MRIYLIRHARSASNDAKLWTGQRDVPLSERGIREQMALCGIFSYPRADVYFSSPLSRCTASLELIYGRGADIICGGLTECAFGAMEGMPYSDLTGDPYYLEWTAHPDRAPEGGESFNAFSERVCRAFSELCAHLAAQGRRSAAGVTHGDVMRAILHRFADSSVAPEEWPIPNGGMYALEADRTGHIVSWSAEPDFLFPRRWAK